MIACLFPGQGSQVVGMAQELADQFPAARAAIEEAEGVLPGLQELMWHGPDSSLRFTANAQPALLAAGVAIYRILADQGLAFGAAAGHSLGEVTALVCAGTLDYPTGLRLVRRRAEHMQAAVPVGYGGMAAVLKATPRQVTAACAAAGNVVPASYNAPEQMVISGAKDAVERASQALQAQGAQVVPLRVSAPFHSPLMAQASVAFRADLAPIPFAPSRFPVVSTVTAQVLESSQLRDTLAQALTAPVRWVEAVETLVRLGVTACVEAGPGTVLTGLMRRIVPSVPCYAVGTGSGLSHFLEAVCGPR
ncbi:MAG: ACP S-malonyltransferase [Deinococcus sp.]|nr:ACP S-malonyltransferase [Deinococcus sp.]